MDRVWPRGLSKERSQIEASLRDLVPSMALRCWFAHDPTRWDEFSRRYRQELMAAGQGERPEDLEAPARRGTLTLGDGARDTANNRAVALRGILEEHW